MAPSFDVQSIMENKKIKIIYWMPLILIPVLVALDRCTKIWAETKLASVGDIRLIRGVLKLRYLENSGAAFGILKNNRILFLVFTVAIMALIAYFYIKYAAAGTIRPMHAVLVSMILAGAVGNFWDRAVRGTVTDFIYVELIDFPVFNLADVYITGACFAAVLLILKTAHDEKNTV